MVVVGMLILSFALFVTAHVAIAYGLLSRPPRWRAPVALLIAPLGVYWAWRERMRIRSYVWIGALALYVIATLIARA
jgi:hypothetical protein